MSGAHRFTDRVAVTQALDEPTLVPHAHRNDDDEAPSMKLRRAMARFSGPIEHPARRATVEQAIRRLDIDTVVAAARLATRACLRAEDSATAVQAVIRSVATNAVAAALGPDDGGTQLVDDVEAVVRVIGRGEPPAPASSAATQRLLRRYADHPDGAVAAVSVLYQNFDATAALVSSLLAAHRTQQPPEPAVAATRRVATADVTIGDAHVGPGDEVTLLIGEAGLPFGSGPHACPGQALATALAAAIVDELTS